MEDATDTRGVVYLLIKCHFCYYNYNFHEYNLQKKYTYFSILHLNVPSNLCVSHSSYLLLRPMTNQRDLRITTSHGTVMTYLHQNRRQWGRSLGIHLPEGSPTTLHIILSLTLHELWNYDRYTSNFVITTGHHRLADMWFSMDRHHLLLNHYPCLDFLKLL